jgi:hypothetical protein
MYGMEGLRNLKQDKGDGEGWPVDQGSHHSNSTVIYNTIGRHSYYRTQRGINIQSICS